MAVRLATGPAGSRTCPAVFPVRFEVLVYRFPGGRQLADAIELVGPGNKGDDDSRDAFTAKVAS